MTRDEAIEAGARALWDHLHNREGAPDYPWDLLSEPPQGVWRERATAVLDAAGWVEPAGYLAAEPGVLLGSYPTFDQAARSGWGEAVYAVVPVEGASKLGGNS